MKRSILVLLVVVTVLGLGVVFNSRAETSGASVPAIPSATPRRVGPRRPASIGQVGLGVVGNVKASKPPQSNKLRSKQPAGLNSGFSGMNMNPLIKAKKPRHFIGGAGDGQSIRRKRPRRH
jgi:hypothetical protein